MRSPFTDGRIRKRDNPTSIGEKIKHGELPFQATRRALGEELGIDHTEDYIGADTSFNVQVREPVISNSYPGLLTKRTIYTLDTYLTKRDFRPEGYREVQEDKTSIFKWIEFAPL